MQDVFIVIGAAVFANVLLLGAIGWYLVRAHRPPKDPVTPVVKPSIEERPTVVAAPPAVVATPARPSVAGDVRPKVATRRFDGARRLIDDSVGMYLFRRLLGRPTSDPSTEPFPAAAYLDEDAVANRIGAAPRPAAARPTGATSGAAAVGTAAAMRATEPTVSAPVPAAFALPGATPSVTATPSIAAAAPPAPVVQRPTRLVVAGSTGSDQPLAPAPVAVATVAATKPTARPSRDAERRGLYRDTFVAVAGFAVVLLFAAALLPDMLRSNDGDVLSATGTPESSAGVIITAEPSPSEVAVVVPPPSGSAAPIESLEPIPTATPEPTPAPTKKPSVTPRPTTRPTATPTPTPTPKPTVKPTPKPTPTPTPVPSPIAGFYCSVVDATITCDASESTNTLSYAWVFGGADGGTDAGLIGRHTYTISGLKTVRLTVTGAGGAVDSDTNQYQVTVP